jgi:hypothetical protein
MNRFLWVEARLCSHFDLIEMKLDLWVAVSRDLTARALSATDATDATASLSLAAQYSCDAQRVQDNTTDDVIKIFQYQLILLRLLLGVVRRVSKKRGLMKNVPKGTSRKSLPSPKRVSPRPILSPTMFPTTLEVRCLMIVAPL